MVSSASCLFNRAIIIVIAAVTVHVYPNKQQQKGRGGGNVKILEGGRVGSTIWSAFTLFIRIIKRQSITGKKTKTSAVAVNGGIK